MAAMNVPIRLGPAEQTLIEQLQAAGAGAEAERLSGAGLPTRKVESYHYTDLKALLRSVPALVSPGEATGRAPFDIEGAYRLPIVNGVPQPPANAPDGMATGVVPGSVLTMRDDVLVRLNGALVRDSLRVDVTRNVDPVVVIDRRTEGAAAHAPSSAKIHVADGASVTIVETYSGSNEAHVTNHGTYLSVGRNAQVTHVTVDLSAGRSAHFATNEYHIAEGARLLTLAVHAGAQLSRTQLFATFAGEGAHADFTGMNLVSDGEHRDITLDVNHAVPRTTSTELFKTIARGRAKAVFQGRIVVARDAQKTDAKMMMQGLMLSDEAEILSKPELEIYADDVVCGHGSTSGTIDEEALFYLMSRGVPRAEAETMLIRAFLGELLDPISHEGLHAALDMVVEDWLTGAA